MRFKLLAIGIVAVLLCAMMPIAVSATSTTQGVPTVQTPIIAHVYNQHKLGSIVGEIFIQPNGNFCFVCFGLKPHDSYLLGMQVTFVVGGVALKVCVPVSEIVVLSGPYHPDAFGVLCARGTFSQSTMTRIDRFLSQGGQFVVFSPQVP